MKKVIYDNNEGSKFEIELRTFNEFHGITLCCIVLNEEKTIKPFIEYYRPHVDCIAIVDGGSIDNTVEIAAPMVDRMIVKKFDGHYSNQMNRAIEMARTDWIFFIEPDERLCKDALEKLRDLINQEEFDCYSFPRDEYIDSKHIPEVYPDYQDRLFKSYCRRIRPVHGEVVGYKKKKNLELNGIWDIIHKKNSITHKNRNIGYSAFNTKFVHELGEPGTQTKDNFCREYKNLLLKEE
jgi:glycosyltransferase involved in cell wall biosynthesis